MRVVVVGAGQAGASLVAKLRALGHTGAITLIGAEPAPPYQRPPLSKAYLTGAMKKERLYLRPASYYADNGIDLCLGATATGIDRTSRTVTVHGKEIAYDALALCLGATPRRLPDAIGGGLGGVFTLRGLADVDAMRPVLRKGRRLLVVGGGYIGLEAAAVARRLGMEVTLIETAPRILGRVAAPDTADYFRALHRANGVELLEGTGLSHLLGTGIVAGAILSNGREIACDAVIAGIGVTPDTALAADAGLTLDNGIATDAHGRTDDPHIWAAGDCASFATGAGRMRLESVQNAIDMAEAVAANIIGADMPYLPQPWFWSDQYDVKLQIAGLNAGYTHLVRRAVGEAVSHWYFADDRLISVDAMNDPRAYMVGKRMIEMGRSPSAEAITATPDLKALLGA